MNELQFQEEWLSAYLDDELTAEQRQVVEQRLAVDPAAQSMLDDLRRVRSMVSKLPAWSGSNLEFAIPSELPSDLPNSLQNDLADEIESPNDFEAVTHSLRGADETAAWKEPPARSLVASRSPLTWLAAAASFLLVLGLGYFYWPSGTLVVSQLDRSNEMSAPTAPAGQRATPEAELEEAGAALSDSANLEAPNLKAPNFEATGAADNGRDLSPSAASNDSGNSGITSSEALRVDPMQTEAPGSPLNLPKRGAQPPAPGTQLRMANPPRDGADDSAAAEPAMNLQPSLQPDNSRGGAAPAELPPPASARSFAESAKDEKPQNSNLRQPLLDAADVKQDTADLPADSLPARSQVRFARSATWGDPRTLNQAAAQSAMFFGQRRPVFDANSDSQFAKRDGGATVAEVLMATVNVDERELSSLFDSVVSANALLAVESAPLTEFSVADADSVARAAGVESSNASESASQLGQFSAPNRADRGLPSVNSLVLFVTRDEARRVLDELKQAGQIASPVWSVQSSVAVPDEAIDRGTAPTNTLPTNTRPTDSTREASERVVLMLNGPAK